MKKRWQIEVHFPQYGDLEAEARKPETMQVVAETLHKAIAEARQKLNKRKTLGRIELCEAGKWEEFKQRQRAAQERARRGAETQRLNREEWLAKSSAEADEQAKGLERVKEDECYGQDYEVRRVAADGLKNAFEKATDQRWRGERMHNGKRFEPSKIRIVCAGEVLMEADIPLWQLAMGKSLGLSPLTGKPHEWTTEDDVHLIEAMTEKAEARERARRGDGVYAFNSKVTIDRGKKPATMQVESVREPTPETAGQKARAAMLAAERRAREVGATVRYEVALRLPDGREVTREIEAKQSGGAGQKAASVAAKELGVRYADIGIVGIALSENNERRERERQ